MPTPLQQIVSKLFTTVRSAFSRMWSGGVPSRERVRDLFASTSDQVLEKAEETRQAVRLRMAQMEIEHYLNRLYPQIGKQFCDQFRPGQGSVDPDEDLQLKVELAAEYRRRLEELRSQIREHQQNSSSTEA